MKKTLTLAIVTLLVVTLFSCNLFTDTINWYSIILKDQIPDPIYRSGTTLENTSTKLSLILYNVPSHEYPSYVDKCMNEHGYSIDIDSESYYFSASNSSGYRVIVIYNADSNELQIILESPEQSNSEPSNALQDVSNDNTSNTNEEQSEETSPPENSTPNVTSPEEETKQPDQPSTSQEMVWIPTNGGKKYHSRADCSNMKNPRQVTKEKAIEMGFSPCKKCH